MPDAAAGAAGSGLRMVPGPNRRSKKPPPWLACWRYCGPQSFCAERADDLAALALAVGAGIALGALEIVQGAVEIAAHLLDLGVERRALGRLAAEQREEAVALAAGAPGLRR